MLSNNSIFAAIKIENMVKCLTFVLILVFGLLMCFGNKAVAINETCPLKGCDGFSMPETFKELYLAKNPVKNGGYGNQYPKAPTKCKTVLYTGTAMFLDGQFGNSVLTLLSVDGRQLYQVAVPQGADEVCIPVLSDIPVEVHINDGVDDYCGYIQ